MIVLSTFVIALLVSMTLIPPLAASAPHLRILDVPDARKQHAAPVPRIGGIAMIAGTALPIGLWLHEEPAVVSWLLATAVLLGFGVWDDRRQIGHRAKFAGQLVAALLVVLGGDVVVRNVPLADAPLPEVVAVPFTIFALVGVTNAINLADGLDGLAGGAALLSLAAIALLAWQASHAVLLLLALATMGSVLGFLRFNTYPARVFMGDTGSQFLGFTLGLLAILLTQDVNRALSPAVVLPIIGLPVIDTLVVMGQRLREGRSPFAPDRNHVHHKLLGLGFDHYEAVLAIYAVQALLVAGGYWLRYHHDGLVLGAYGAVLAGVAGFFHHAARTGWKMRTDNAAMIGASVMRKRIAEMRDRDFAGRVAVFVCSAGAVTTLAGAVVAATEMPGDLRTLTAWLLVATLASAALHAGRVGTDLSDRATYYLTGGLVVYLTAPPGALPAVAGTTLDVVAFAMAGSLAIAFRYSRDRTFKVTPLDFLVILLALALPTLPEESAHGPSGSDVARMIVMFYAGEYLVRRLEHRAVSLRLAVLAGLSALLAGSCL